MMVPVWIYLVYSALKETYDLSWYECLKLCRTILLVQVLAALCLFFLPGWSDALINAIPFVSVELCAMVCSLRYFRQEHTGGMISLGLCAGVSLFSLFAALTGFFPVLFGKFKQWYLRLVSLLFNIGSAQVLPPAEEIEIPSAVNPDLPSGELMPSDGNAMPAVIEQIKEMGLLEKIIIVLIIVIAVCTIIYLLFYSMKGHRYYRREHEGDISEKITPEKKHRLSLFVPSDPKEAIFYMNTHLPDIIFLDCYMTVMDTKKILSIVRSYKEMEKVPVYFMVYEEEKYVFEHKKDTGAVGLITRPIARGDLQEILDKEKLREYLEK
jgi:CheY-like chemotaxis protein